MTDRSNHFDDDREVRFQMDKIKIWPHAALIVFAFVVIAAIGTGLYLKYERSAQASGLPNAARIERVEGQIAINQSLDQGAGSKFVEATPNTPITVGDRIYARDNSSSQIAFTGRNFATIESNTALDVLDLSNERTQLALREGAALFDIGSLASGQTFEVATPCGAVDLEKSGIYQISIDQDGNALAKAFSGEAQVVGQGGTGSIEKGESLSLSCQGNSPAVVSRVDAGDAGTVIDKYYRARYPRTYDGRYRSYETYLQDPNYFDQSRRNHSYDYVSENIPGVYDLDDYGDWQYVNDYGYCWHPRVANDWAPYQSGSWTTDYPYGLTWVSNEPWGYAPYHYGRWTYASNEWFWIPDRARSYPNYSPALVAFVSFNDNNVGWVPLGPGDPYAPHYYDQNWRAVYSGRRDVITDRVVNLSVPGALTVIQMQDFGRPIDRRGLSRIDPQAVARARPVLDPLTVDSLRRVAFQSRDERRRIDIPPAVAQRILNRPVVVNGATESAGFRRDLARNLRVQQLPDRARGQRLQIADQRSSQADQNRTQPNRPDTLAAEQDRERRIADLSRQAARGDRNARQQMQDLRQQQFEEKRTERANVQAAQGERVRQSMQEKQNGRDALRQQQQQQRESARQQMITSEQTRRAAAQQQLQSQRRQVERQRAPERHSQKSQTIRPQTQPQRVERKAPPAYRRSEQPRTISPPRQEARPQRQPSAPQAAPRAMSPPRVMSPPRTISPPRQPGPPSKQPAQPRPPAQKGGGRKKP
jgi:FecR protein